MLASLRLVEHLLTQLRHELRPLSRPAHRDRHRSRRDAAGQDSVTSGKDLAWFLGGLIVLAIFAYILVSM
jgi:hypothetical protein